MFAHFTQGTNDMYKSVAFYDALLAPLDIKRNEATIHPEVVCYQNTQNDLPRFFVVAPYDNKPATSGNGSMIAFNATSQEQVDSGYQNGIQSGGTDAGPPGDRPHYADGYYGAYLRDPDGNKVHLVYRGDLDQEST